MLLKAKRIIMIKGVKATCYLRMNRASISWSFFCSDFLPNTCYYRNLQWATPPTWQSRASLTLSITISSWCAFSCGCLKCSLPSTFGFPVNASFWRYGVFAHSNWVSFLISDIKWSTPLSIRRGANGETRQAVSSPHVEFLPHRTGVRFRCLSAL